mmetsp:Transcript_37228/g.89166  ORF Transcript_37228/g.89166 Transcript_37228/m.89166 type:complete len:210 (+) Transcript_37228:156-785(+)
MRAALLGVASTSPAMSSRRFGDARAPRPPRPRPRPPRPRPAASIHFIRRSFSRLARIFSISAISPAMVLAASFSAAFFSFAATLLSAASAAESWRAKISFSPWSLKTLFMASATSFSFFLASSMAFLAASCASWAFFRASSSSAVLARPSISSSRTLTVLACSEPDSRASCALLDASILARRAARSFSRATASLELAASTCKLACACSF